MSQEAFLACLAFTLKYEGGYVDHPADPGGATNLGVTRATLAKWRGRPVTKADVRALSRDEAAQIYNRYYWEPCGGPRLPAGVDALVFDWAVHSGPSRAIRALQKVLGVTIDGSAGPALQQAIQKADVTRTIRDLCSERRKFLARLKGFAVFGRGWSRRVDALEKTALSMAR
ncbi:MAG: glycosyl hydrolase 108 family protein [Beijerinckiaceae bacterium]|nr:glycosyl hydrolase 108 family protein [Beijerinckiaceae bacterium]